MLRKLTFSSLSLLFCFSLTAQVTETVEKMSLGHRPGYKIVVQNADEKLVTKEWKDYVKKNFDAKLKKGKKGEMIAEGATGGIFEDKTGTIYSRVEQEGTDAIIYAWFDDGTSFVTKGVGAAGAGAISLGAFQKDTRRTAVGLEIEEQEKQLKKLEDNLKKLKKQNDDLKDTIKQAEKDLAQNEKDQETAVKDIKAQEKKLEDTKVRLKNIGNEKN